jgi:hypothetical protein
VKEDLTALDEPIFGRRDFFGVTSADDVHNERRVFEEVEYNTSAGIDENLERTLQAVLRRVGWKAAEQTIEAIWNTVDPVDIPRLTEGYREGLGKRPCFGGQLAVNAGSNQSQRD